MICTHVSQKRYECKAIAGGRPIDSEATYSTHILYLFSVTSSYASCDRQRQRQRQRSSERGREGGREGGPEPSPAPRVSPLRRTAACGGGDGGGGGGHAVARPPSVEYRVRRYRYASVEIRVVMVMDSWWRRLGFSLNFSEGRSRGRFRISCVSVCELCTLQRELGFQLCSAAQPALSRLTHRYR